MKKRAFEYKKIASKGAIGLFQILLTTIICSIAALGILSIAFMVPINRENLYESIALGTEEGYYVDSLEHLPSLEKYFVQFQPGTMTVADDVRGFKMVDDHEGFNPIQNALYCNNYPRYWHGYIAVMRVLFLFFDYKEMRFLNLLLQVFLVLWIFLILRERGEKKISWISLIWYVLMMPLSVACCLVFGYVVDAILALTIFVMLYGEKIWNQKPKLHIVFCIIGCVVCFFDLLIFSPMGWAMPFAMLVILYGRKDDVLQNMVKTVISAISWVIGYAGFWLLKMAYATVILGDKYERNIFEGALGEVMISAANIKTAPVGLIAKISERWLAVSTNYKHYGYSVYALLIIALTIVALLGFVRNGIKTEKDSRLLPLLIVTVSPVIWLFTINTATKEHHIFDYRLLSTEICCALIIIFLSINLNRSIHGPKKILKRIFVVLAVLVLGIIPALSTRESQHSSNADKSGIQYIPFPESGVVKMEFIPSFSEITSFGLSVAPETGNGNVSIALLENGSVKDEIVIPAKDFHENNWQLIDTDWKLSIKQKYEIEVRLLNGNESGYVSVLLNTLEGNIPELGCLSYDDQYLPCQLVGWINYNRRPSLYKILAYGMMISGFIAALLLTFALSLPSRTRNY